MTEPPIEARASLLAEDGTPVEMQITLGPLDEARIEALARLWAEILVAALNGAEEARAPPETAMPPREPPRGRRRVWSPRGRHRRESITTAAGEDTTHTGASEEPLR